MMIPSGNSWVTSLHSEPTIVHNLVGASLGTSDSTQDHDLNNKESTSSTCSTQRRELLPQQTAMDAATTNTKDCHCRKSWLRGTPQRLERHWRKRTPQRRTKRISRRLDLCARSGLTNSYTVHMAGKDRSLCGCRRRTSWVHSAWAGGWCAQIPSSAGCGVRPA